MGTEEGQYVVGCRVRAVGGGWVYRYSTLYASPDVDITSTELRIEPAQDTFVPSGTNVNVSCSSKKYNVCDYRNVNGRLKPCTNNDVLTTNPCGVSVDVTDKNNGMIWCYGGDDVRGTSLVAAKPPTESPELSLSVENLSSGEDWLFATCTVMESNPPAEQSWRLYVDSVEVQGFVVEEITYERWRWSWQAERRRQRLTLNVTQMHHGKKAAVHCYVRHMDMEGTLESSQSIILDVVNVNAITWIWITVVICGIVFMFFGCLLFCLRITKRWIFKGFRWPESEHDYAAIEESNTLRTNGHLDSEVIYTEPLNEYEDLNTMYPGGSGHNVGRGNVPVVPVYAEPHKLSAPSKNLHKKPDVNYTEPLNEYAEIGLKNPEPIKKKTPDIVEVE